MENEEVESPKNAETLETTMVATQETTNLYKIAIDVHNNGHGFYDNEKRASLLNDGYTTEQVHDIMGIAGKIR